MAGDLGKFEMDEGTQGALKWVITASGIGTPAKDAIAVMLAANSATMPNTNVLFVDTDGMAAELKERRQ